MPRTRRSDYLTDGSYYHVISRSINQTPIFRDAEDFARFRHLEREAKQQFPIRLFHYVFMTTHFHLVLQTVRSVDLALHLRYLKWHYTLWMRKKYGWNGPIWRERYRSIPIEDETYLSACGLYVELNPLRAGICATAEEYAFSSARKYGLGQPDDLLDEYYPTPVSEPLAAAARNPLVADLIFARSDQVMIPAASQ